jgi:hypothetical protein
MSDLETIDAFVRAKIRSAVATLSEQANVVSRNRRPLRASVGWCPTATWQLRVESYRVMYRFEPGEVQVLRVKFKGSATTEESGT